MSTLKGVAFFPWLPIDAPVTIGPIRLLPYARGKLPGDSSAAAQADLDAILRPYSYWAGEPVRKATLLEVDEWHVGDALQQATITRLFAAQNAVAFGGLGARRLFQGHFSYCGFHNFQLVVRNYNAATPEFFSYTERRRDGSHSHLWTTRDRFGFHKPLHVVKPLGSIEIDDQLARLAMDSTLPDRWAEAIAEFNLANTDSSDVAQHVEMVMMKSAFEQLLDIGPQAKEFSDALERALGAVAGDRAHPWLQANPNSNTAIGAWAREFAKRRGVAAHRGKGAPSYQWPEHSHLAFASLLFPLVFKKLASDAGLLAVDEAFLDRLDLLDRYLIEDPFSQQYSDDDDTDIAGKPTDKMHPWARVDHQVASRELARRMYPLMQEALDAIKAEKGGDGES